MGNTIQKMAFPYPNPPYNFRSEPIYISNSRGDKIPILYFPITQKNTKADKNLKLIIFSHGNATDLAASEYFLMQLREKFHVSVLGYEYLGYGHSVPAEQTSTSSVRTCDYPSEDGCYESLAMAWNHARRILGYEPEDIILMGQSIGSGPTCEIAERISLKGKKPIEKDGFCAFSSGCSTSTISDTDSTEGSSNLDNDTEHKLGGVILISPFRSAAKVITNNPMGYFVDFFCNENKIANIAAPILIIHGSSDCVIAYDHAEHMVDVCKRKGIKCVDLCPVPGADHNDIFERQETSDAIHKFLEGLYVSV